MKVLHISASDSGGAGTAARRLHEGLRRIGVDSKFLAQNKNTKTVPEVYQAPTPEHSFMSRVLDRVGIAPQLEQKQQKQLAAFPGKVGFFSFPYTSYRLDEHPLVQEADIINLHWVSGFLDYPSFFGNVKKPIIYTIHDENPYLGGFHTQPDMDANSGAILELEKKLSAEKEEILRPLKNLTISGPSQWMLDLSMASRAMEGKEHLRVPYGLDMEIYRPLNRDFCRDIFGIPRDATVILFVAVVINSHIKGGDYLLEAHSKIQGDDLVLAYAGTGMIEDADPRIIPVGYISDDRLMAQLYNTADFAIIPSRRDNFPSVMLEAMACGKPVLSFNVGGMAEIVEDGFNGLKAYEMNAEALEKIIRQFLDTRDQYNSEKIREFALQNFSMETYARRYEQIYKDHLN